MSIHDQETQPPVEPTAETNDLAEHVRQAAQQNQQLSSQQPSIPHGQEPVSYPYGETPLSGAPVATTAPDYPPAGITRSREPINVDAGTPDYGSTPSAELLSTKRRSSRRRKIAIGATAVVVVAGAGVLVDQMAGRKPHKQISTPGTNVSFGPGSDASVDGSTPASTVSPTEINPLNQQNPNIVTHVAAQAGNLNLVSSLPNHLYERWNSENWVLPPALYEPGSVVAGSPYDTQNLGNDALAQLSALLTFDPNSQAYKDVLATFTDSAQVAAYVLQLNQNFQAERVGDIPYSNQDIVFDTAQDPVQFGDQGTDASGNKAIGIDNGTLYTRPLNSRCYFVSGTCTIGPSRGQDSIPTQQDTRADVPDEAKTVQKFWFSFESGDNGTVKVAVLQYSPNR